MSSKQGRDALKAAQGNHSSQPGIGPGAGPVVSEATDSQLLQGQHDRTYNPVDGASRGLAGQALNSDAARYKKGPGPY